MLKKVICSLSLLIGSAAFAQEENFNLMITRVTGVAYFKGNRTPPGTTEVYVKGILNGAGGEEKKLLFFMNSIADNCTKLLHIALASTLSDSPKEMLKTVSFASDANSGVVTACSLGKKVL